MGGVSEWAMTETVGFEEEGQEINYNWDRSNGDRFRDNNNQ